MSQLKNLGTPLSRETKAKKPPSNSRAGRGFTRCQPPGSPGPAAACAPALRGHSSSPPRAQLRGGQRTSPAPVLATRWSLHSPRPRSSPAARGRGPAAPPSCIPGAGRAAPPALRTGSEQGPSSQRRQGGAEAPPAPAEHSAPHPARCPGPARLPSLPALRPAPGRRRPPRPGPGSGPACGGGGAAPARPLPSLPAALGSAGPGIC